MMQVGNPELLGATPDDSGTNFAIYSAIADSVELCLFSADGKQEQVFDLPECSDGVWHGYLPGCTAGQHMSRRGWRRLRRPSNRAGAATR